MNRIIFPTPKQAVWGEERPVPRGFRWKITASAGVKDTKKTAEDMLEKLIPGICFSDLQPDVELNLETGFRHEQPEAYVLRIKDRKCFIYGADRAGVICGLATLRQLMMENGAWSGTIPDVEITDWPDIRWRAASRWLVDLEATRMAYDWGDGRENFLRRYREKIDFAMHYKINVAFFEGFTWDIHKYPEYIEDVLSLNRYAAARNVALEFGGHYVGIGGRNPEYNEVSHCGFVPGLGDLNRYHYPDGEPYPCTGKSEDHPTRLNGACHSNDPLNELKMKQLAEYVRLLEPRVLYLHPEDIETIAKLANDWSFRCPRCREMWPSDLPEAGDGAAGAQAYTLVKLYEAVCGIKNPESGYDGSRDCLFIIVPAAYAAGNLSDADYEREITMYRNMADLLPESPNILLLMREQLQKSPSHKNRVAEMADRCPAEIAVFSVNGADNYSSGRIFEPGALLNGFYSGAKLIFNFSGTLCQEAQEAFNAECCWNLPAVPDVGEQFYPQMAGERARLKIIPDIFPQYWKIMEDPEGFVSQFCRSFYGDEAGNAMAEILRSGAASSEYPMCTMEFVFNREHLFEETSTVSSVQTDLPEIRKHWHSVAEMTRAAYDRISSIGEGPADPWAKESMLRLKDTLGLTMRISRLVCGLVSEEPQIQKLRKELEEARQYMEQHFKFSFLSGADGENARWHLYLDRIERQIEKA